MNTTKISALILVYNEEIHLRRCLESIKDVVDNIFIVDSFSTDKSLEIAKEYNAIIYQNKWENSYAKQFNWGLENFPIKSRWLLRIDADEYLTEGFRQYLKYELEKVTNEISGIYINRRINFLGKEIKHGGKQLEWQLRVFKYGKGFCEKRWMDEHIKIISGKTMKINVKLIDYNLNNLTWWIDKHNKYAVREALDVLNQKYGFNRSIQLKGHLFKSQAERKRFLKSYYNKIPLFFGPLFYFFYRYFFLLGFLDGKKGFIFHFMQALWYRFLVDVKKYEIEIKGGFNREQILLIFKNEYNVTIEI